jgi:hypothetical protein
LIAVLKLPPRRRTYTTKRSLVMKRAKETKRIKSVTTTSPSSEKPHSGGLVGKKFTIWMNATTPHHHGTVVAQIEQGVYLVQFDETKIQQLVSLTRMMASVERGPGTWEFS